MSQTTPHSANHRPSNGARNLSTPQLRAVRKELLLMRAEVERAEIAQATAELRHNISNFSWLKLLVPGSGLSRIRRSSKGFNAMLSEVVTQHPLLSSIASILLAKPLRGVLKVSAKPVLKWGGLGLAIWKAYQIWQQIKEDTPDKESQRGNAGGDVTSTS